MKFIYKIFLRLFGEEYLLAKDINEKEINDWLFEGYGNRGFKAYYTIRKKAIENQMSLGLKDREYWEMVGRVKELKTLTRRVDDEFERRKSKQEKKFE